MKLLNKHRHFLQHTSSILVLLFLLVMTYIYFAQIPYFGLDLQMSTQEITHIYDTTKTNVEINIGDQIIRVGDVEWSAFIFDPSFDKWQNAIENGFLNLTISRDNQQQEVKWEIPKTHSEEFRTRLIAPWWIAYVFWVTGVITQLMVRPKDTKWYLFVAFNFINAVWLMAGTLAFLANLIAAQIFIFALWLSVPIYLHLHWLIPQPLFKVPKWLIITLYAVFIFFAILAGVFFVPLQLTIPFLLAMGGSFVLLLIHLIFFPAHRYRLRFMLVSLTLILFANIIYGLLLSRSNNVSSAILNPLFLLPILALSYLYAIYKEQLGTFKLRTNTAVSLYLFMAVMSIFLMLLALFVNLQQLNPQRLTAIYFVTILSAILLTALGFPRFKNLVEQYVLNIPITHSRLLEVYSSHIITSVGQADLVKVLQEQIVPTLLIRQSALLHFEDAQYIDVVYADNVPTEAIPQPQHIKTLITHSGRYFPVAVGSPFANAWIRLALPLRLGGKVIGLWLLGKRDPDDMYAYAEIPTLQAVADQTAIALVNIQQRENLQTSYRMNIQKQEGERKTIALELHDDILNGLAILTMHIDKDHVSPYFDAAYNKLVERLRETIHNLRPAMLNYGLWIALREFVEELQDRDDYNDIDILFSVEHDDNRHSELVEQHVFRIVQQSVENALQHAEAQVIRIYGTIIEGKIDLIIEDNGVGFDWQGQLNLTKLLEKKHYGLVGMYERSELIEASLYLDSTPSEGTKLTLRYEPAKQTTE